MALAVSCTITTALDSTCDFLSLSKRNDFVLFISQGTSCVLLSICFVNYLEDSCAKEINISSLPSIPNSSLPRSSASSMKNSLSSLLAASVKHRKVQARKTNRIAFILQTNEQNKKKKRSCHHISRIFLTKSSSPANFRHLFDVRPK